MIRIRQSIGAKQQMTSSVSSMHGLCGVSVRFRASFATQTTHRACIEEIA